MTRTLAVANQKGGVAKTTTVASLGVALRELGRRVLLVDLDPQACLTFSLGIDPEDLDVSLHNVLVREKQPADVCVCTDEGVDLLPATIELAAAEAALLTRTGREQAVRAALTGFAADYDWVLLDCPPSLGILTVGALSAADDVLIPLQCETLSHRGVGQLLDTVYDVRQFTNPALEDMQSAFAPVPGLKVSSSVPSAFRRATRFLLTEFTDVKNPTNTIFPSGWTSSSDALVLSVGILNVASLVPSVFKRTTQRRTPGASPGNCINPATMIFPSG